MSSNSQKPSNSTSRAFTLIELLVVMVIFVTIISVVITIFGQVLKSQRVIFALQSVQDDTRYALETIAREIRMADVITPQGSDPHQGGGFEELEILNYKGENVKFKWFYNEPQRQLKVSRDDGPYIPLTSENIEITNVQFYIRKCTTTEPVVEIQPRVTISIAARSFQEAYQGRTEMYLETTVSTRMYK